MSKETILVTGASGFIGSHLLESLLTLNYKIVIIERSDSNHERIKDLLKQVKIYFSDRNETEKAFKNNKIDYVIHLAAKYIKAHSSVEEVNSIIDTNVKFSVDLCQYCVQYKVKGFINTGTFFEYKMQNRPIKEDDIEKPYNLYSASKLSFQEILKYYSQNYKLKSVTLRLFSPFGDRDNEKLMSFLVKALNSGDKLEFSGGEQRWNFTYVKDTVLAFVEALDYLNKSQEKYSVFNIGYDKVYSIKQVAAKLEKISGKKFNILWGAKPYIENEIYYANCDNSKAKKVLNWQPKYDIDYGLKKTYEYYSKRKKHGE